MNSPQDSKLQQRAKRFVHSPSRFDDYRFNIVPEDQKRSVRASRFGNVQPVVPNSDSLKSGEKMKIRAERYAKLSLFLNAGRFGVTQKTISKEEVSKRKMREARFGLSPIASDDKLQKRAERFQIRA